VAAPLLGEAPQTRVSRTCEAMIRASTVTGSAARKSSVSWEPEGTTWRLVRSEPARRCSSSWRAGSAAITRVTWSRVSGRARSRASTSAAARSAGGRWRRPWSRLSGKSAPNGRVRSSASASAGSGSTPRRSASRRQRDATSHSRTVPSEEPEARVLPSGLKATEWTRLARLIPARSDSTFSKCSPSSTRGGKDGIATTAPAARNPSTSHAVNRMPAPVSPPRAPRRTATSAVGRAHRGRCSNRAASRGCRRARA